MGSHGGEHGVRGFGGDDGDQLAFVRHIEWIEAEHFAGAAHLFTNRDATLRAGACRRGPIAAISLSALDRPPRVGSRMRADRRRGPEHGVDQRVQRRRNRFERALEFQAFAFGHDGDAVIAERAAEEDDVAGPRVAGGEIERPRAPRRCRTC